MRDVKATERSRGENENGGIRVGSRLGKKGRLCRKTFVRLLCLTAAMMVLGSFTAFARAGGASGGGGGGGGSSHHHTSSSRGQGGRAGAFQALLLTGTFVILGSAGTITYLHRAIIGIGVRYRSGCGNHITGFRNAGGIVIWKKGILT